MTNQDKIKIASGIGMFALLIYLYVVEFEFIVNTVNVAQLALFAFVMGLVVVSFLLLIQMKKLTLFERFMAFMASLVLLAIIMPLLASLSNRHLDRQAAQIQALPLERLEARSEQPYGLLDSTNIQVDAYRAWVKFGDEATSFYLKRDFKFKHTEDSIFLPMKQGFWGYPYVDLSQQ